MILKTPFPPAKAVQQVRDQKQGDFTTDLFNSSLNQIFEDPDFMSKCLEYLNILNGFVWASNIELFPENKINSESPSKRTSVESSNVKEERREVTAQASSTGNSATSSVKKNGFEKQFSKIANVSGKSSDCEEDLDLVSCNLD